MNLIGRRSAVMAAGVLAIGGVAGLAVTMYMIGDPAARLRVGMAFFVMSMWPMAVVAHRAGVVDASCTEQPRRRFSELRRRVGQLLREIRRLNWLAFDVEHGLRTREKTMEEPSRSRGL